MTRDLTRDAFVAVLRQHTFVRGTAPWNSYCTCQALLLDARGYAEHVADVLFDAEVRA